MNRVVETTVTVLIQKYAKVCCHETTWAIILMTPIHFLEASDQVRLRLHCSKEAGLLYTRQWFFLKEQLHEFT